MTDDRLPAHDQGHPDRLPVEPTEPAPRRAPEASTAAAGTDVVPNPRIQPYVEAARHQLADLPASERAELLDDLDAHLHEILTEEGPVFESRLGTPAQYAEEFRASAGYPGAGDARLGSVQRARRRTRDWSERLVDWVRAAPGGSALPVVLRRLRPAWWVLRGWLAAYLVLGDPLLDSLGFGRTRTGVVLVAFLALSVAWGIRAEQKGRALPVVERILLIGVNATAILLCLGGAIGVGSLAYVGSSSDVYSPEPDPVVSPGLTLDGSPVTNLVAYDLAGKPIQGFQLFTQDGDPVSVDESYAPGSDDGWVHPVPVTTSNGTPVPNVFPIRRVVTGEADAYYCVTATTEDPCNPYAMSTVQGELPAPEGSPWKDLTVTPVPAVGSTLPLDEGLQPIWARLAPAQVGSPSPTPSPSPAGAALPSPTAKSSADGTAKPGDDSPSPSSDRG